MSNKYEKFTFSDRDYTITKTVTKYKRTASGKSWKSKPECVKDEIIDAEHYENYIRSIPFFNNYGNGAYCRAEYEYTYAGYLPTKVTTVSPFQEIKLIAEFKFERSK